MTEWSAVCCQRGEWYWYTALPNGWIAAVTDFTQSHVPRESTAYRIVACSSERYFTSRKTFKTFGEAKAAAILFAIASAERHPVTPVAKRKNSE